MSKTGGSGIRITDTTNVSSLRINFTNSTATISSAKDGSVATTTIFQTQTAAGSTTNTLTLSSGSTVGVCDIFTDFTGTSDAKILRLDFGASTFNRKILFGCRTGGYNFIQGTQSASETQYRDLCLQPDGGSIIIGGPTTGPSPATAQSLLNTYIDSSGGGALTTLAEFRNVDYTALTRSFIRVRQGANIGSSYSSYFGTGQNGNCYIIANDSSRGGDIIIAPTTGAVTIPNLAGTGDRIVQASSTGLLSATTLATGTFVRMISINYTIITYSYTNITTHQSMLSTSVPIVAGNIYRVSASTNVQASGGSTLTNSVMSVSTISNPPSTATSPFALTYRSSFTPVNPNTMYSQNGFVILTGTQLGGTGTNTIYLNLLFNATCGFNLTPDNVAAYPLSFTIELVG